MKKRIIFELVGLVIVFSLLLSSCQTGGIPRTEYNEIATQLANAQSALTKAQSDLVKAQADKATVESQLKAAQSQVALLQEQIKTLKDKSTLTGATLADTAARIVKYYNETHVYSTYDLFVCSDMASEVWNMLKAQGISAVVVVGRKDALIDDILLSDHAWVLATVDGNALLALETTNGTVVAKAENPYYYNGWAFKSPAELKAYNDMIKEYNVRVGFRNTLNSEATKAFNAGNDSLYAKLVELRTAQETELNNIMAKVKALAVRIY